jgi:hypothetical protein
MGAGRCRSQDAVVRNRGQLGGALKVHRQPIASGILAIAACKRSVSGVMRMSCAVTRSLNTFSSVSHRAFYWWRF